MPSKKDLIKKFGLDYVEINAFSDCKHSGLPVKYFIHYISIKLNLKPSTIYSHWRKYIEKIDTENRQKPQ